MNQNTRALFVAVGCVLAASCGATVATPPAATTPVVDFTKSAVQVVANGCSSIEVHGAGLMVGAGRIATVAHVVAGAKSVDVRGVRGTAQATVVYFDPVLDLAVLKVDPTLAPPVAIGSAAAGDRGGVIVYRKGAPVELPVSVERIVNIRTGDIYLQGTHIRPGYELNLDIQAGDSGAVVVIGGKAVALVWATSREAKARAWAMQASLLADHLSGETAVDHGTCA
ncbi:MAG TPA: trypsin-like peptidase domain-containing protein [Ilumatobacteraceae bacterium]|nr:trypsin-like peptidase domain-containing protein [Ilumatobacteraceae bacterium]